MKKTFLILLITLLLFPCLVFASNGFMSLDKIDLVDVIMALEEDQNLLEESNRVITTKEFNVGYDELNGQLVAVGYGKNRNLAIVDAYRSAIKEIDSQLTARMNRFVASTLLDMTDYVRFYAINRSRLVGMILEMSEDKILEEYNNGMFVSRYVGTVDFNTAFASMINAASQQMSVSEEVATEAAILVNRISTYYASEDPKVFTFADDELIR